MIAFRMGIQPRQDKKCFIKGVNCLDLGVGPQAILMICKFRHRISHVLKPSSISLRMPLDPMELISKAHQIRARTAQIMAEITVEITVEIMGEIVDKNP